VVHDDNFAVTLKSRWLSIRSFLAAAVNVAAPAGACEARIIRLSAIEFLM
jgi:hypothetical protein